MSTIVNNIKDFKEIKKKLKTEFIDPIIQGIEKKNYFTKS